MLMLMLMRHCAEDASTPHIHDHESQIVNDVNEALTLFRHESLGYTPLRNFSSILAKSVYLERNAPEPQHAGAAADQINDSLR